MFKSQATAQAQVGDPNFGTILCPYLECSADFEHEQKENKNGPNLGRGLAQAWEKDYVGVSLAL